MDAATFRADFPEFADASTYPDGSVNFWLSVAGLSLNATRWSTLLNVGTELFVAHHLVLAANDAARVARGGRPGLVQGVQTAKAVDKVSASMDAGSVTLTDAGFWNMSSYGIRFLQMSRMIGAGGIQIDGPGQSPV